MDFEEFSNATVKQINRETKKILVEWKSAVGKESKVLLPLVDKFIASCEGGKIIRGSLVVLGYELGLNVILRTKSEGSSAADWEDPSLITQNDIYTVAAAYEIFHSAILAHDDVIDQSLLRRGKASLYQDIGGGHFGVSQAICLGDSGFFLAAKIISQTNFSSEQKVKSLEWFFKVMLDTGVGQMLDIAKGDVTTIMKLKTARYSITGPLILGAILAGADQKLVGALGGFGESLGMAFQIQDDILGVFGSEEILGKSVTSDIEEGKNTLLFKYAFESANQKQKQSLKKLYGRGKINAQGTKIVRQIFETTGALAHAKKAVEGYQNAARKVLSQITKDSKMSKILQQLIEYLINRNK
ncbi:polyprenyl synthetase family protein [Patescibacteria group bacterium]|nr:polyprenyl synthetase family protein [Patescibacteria group bacterium]